MTGPIDRHSPRREFRASLAAEVSRAYRLETRLDSERAPRRRLGWMTVGRLAAALAIGLFAGGLPAQVQDAQQRRALLESAEAQVRLATVRLSLVEEQVERAVRQVEAGALGRESLVALQASLRAAEARLETARLNVEEVTATSGPPRDDLAAPLVRQRDFVRERLAPQISVAEQELLVAQQALDVAARRHRVGAIGDLELHAARVEMERARLRTAALANRIVVRERALRERLAPAEVERLAAEQDLQHQLEAAKLMLRLSEQRLAAVAERHRVGVSTRAELLRAELERLEYEEEVARLQRALRAVAAPEEEAR
ncbi:MAG: hypothetical protein ABR551_11925 [Gemmatimonadales bacterium]